MITVLWPRLCSNKHAGIQEVMAVESAVIVLQEQSKQCVRVDGLLVDEYPDMFAVRAQVQRNHITLFFKW